MKLTANEFTAYYADNQQPVIHLTKKAFGLILSHKARSDDPHQVVVIHIGSIDYEENNLFNFEDYERATRSLLKAFEEVAQHYSSLLKIQLITPKINLEHSRRVLKNFFSRKDVQNDLKSKKIILTDNSTCSIEEDHLERIVTNLIHHPYSNFEVSAPDNIKSLDHKNKIQKHNIWKSRLLPNCLRPETNEEDPPGVNSSLTQSV